MDDQTLAKLEFDHVRQALARQCACGLGRSLVERLRPSANAPEVRRWLDQVRELMDIEPDLGLPPIGGMRDIRPLVRGSGKPGGLEPEELGEVQCTLAATGLLCRWLARVPAERSLLRAFVGRVSDHTGLADTIDQAIDSRGAVRDEASPRLAAIRSRIETLRDETGTVFTRILRQPKYQKILQYPSTTFHNDRVVLPLKAEFRGRLPGIVHRSSDSGATLFIEPSEAVELNNAVARLKVKELEEVSRIVSALSRQVHQQQDDILRTLEACSVLDLLAAKVKYALSRAAICPRLSDHGLLDLHGARHPVLVDLFEGSDTAVVPIDIRLGDDFDVLVITGPNTGGKTVSLKTVGLLAAMTQSGIPIPADRGSIMPLYRRIFIDIGDEQSIEQSLSTFSAHLTNICRILRAAGPGTLVLIDELGAGTDPDEGAAIGQAILDELLDLGCSAIVTTHSSQLKAAAYTLARVDNASVEFDLESLAPTYVLRLGEPGNSNALAIAQRLGLPERVVQAARRHIDDQHRALSRAIEGTLDARRQAEEARKSAAAARQEAERVTESYQEKSRQLDHQRAAHQAWVAWINNLRPGDPVHVDAMGKVASVVRMQLHKQSALVCIGAIDYEVQLNAISQPPRPETTPR